MRAYSSLVCAAALASTSAVAGAVAAAEINPTSPSRAPPSQTVAATAVADISVAGEPSAGTTSVASETAATRAIDGIGTAVASDRLSGLRGGDDTATSIIVIDGSVTDNHAENVVSGSNTINGGAFGNSAGVTSVIQNSGANVLIQNAMIVNVQFTDPGP